MSIPRRTPLLATLSPAALLVAGCADFGTGGTGELVIDAARTQTIDELELPIAEVSTQPAPLPDTRPSAFVEQEARPLRIEDARAAALENNLQLKVDLYEPTIAAQGLNVEQARFESAFRLDASYSTFDSPTASQLSGAQGNTLNITPSLVIPLHTGGTLTFAVPTSRGETDNTFSTLNPSYSSDFTFAFSQPLLRGAGIDANAVGIRLAFYGLQQTAARTKLNVIRLLADVDRAYWELFAARQTLEVRLAEFELAQAQLERARRRVRAGDAADVEILRAESNVADVLQSIIFAENRVRDTQRSLKRIMNVPGLAMDGVTRLDPQTQPTAFRFVADGHQLAEEALARRMELLEQELQIAAQTAQVLSARNAALPLVALDYRYNVNGLGDSYGNSFGQLGDWDFEDHTVGMSVEVPIGNEGARSALRQALLRRLQALASYEDRVLQVRLEVLTAADALDTLWQAIVAARRRVALNQRLYEAEVRQFEVGLRTSTEVREAQIRLANARVDEISVVSDYQIARVDLAYATGSVLAASGVVWEPAEAPTVGYFGQQGAAHPDAVMPPLPER